MNQQLRERIKKAADNDWPLLHPEQRCIKTTDG
jgi:hypothetical protein